MGNSFYYFVCQFDRKSDLRSCLRLSFNKIINKKGMVKKKQYMKMNNIWITFVILFLALKYKERREKRHLQKLLCLLKL